MKHSTRKDYSMAYEAAKQSPVKAIRIHCLECVGYARPEVELCTSKACALYPHRLPSPGSDAQKIAAKDSYDRRSPEQKLAMKHSEND